MSWFGPPRLWELTTPGSDLRLGWGLKQTCSSPQELSNSVSHSICAHRGRVDSWLFVVGSQTASSTPSLSFEHNLCCRCSNGSCDAIFDIYTLRPFQHYKEHLKARCFSLCCRALKLRESRRTPSSHFWECESHPHTCPKVGLQQYRSCVNLSKGKQNTTCTLHCKVVRMWLYNRRWQKFKWKDPRTSNDEMQVQVDGGGVVTREDIKSEWP
jgi:hypothetical protein